jgi:hypothetical protein
MVSGAHFFVQNELDDFGNTCFAQLNKNCRNGKGESKMNTFLKVLTIVGVAGGILFLGGKAATYFHKSKTA